MHKPVQQLAVASIELTAENTLKLAQATVARNTKLMGKNTYKHVRSSRFRPVFRSQKFTLKIRA